MPQNKSSRGLYRDNGKSNGNYYSILGFNRDMEKKMEATIVYWDVSSTLFCGCVETKHGKTSNPEPYISSTLK